MKPFAQSAEDTARSILKQDWADLAASLQAKPTEPVGGKSQAASPSFARSLRPQPPQMPESAPENSAPPDSKPLKQSAEDTARSIPKQDWADLAASLQTKPIEPVAEKAKPRRRVSPRLLPRPLQAPNRAREFSIAGFETADAKRRGYGALDSQAGLGRFVCQPSSKTIEPVPEKQRPRLRVPSDLPPWTIRLTGLHPQTPPRLIPSRRSKTWKIRRTRFPSKIGPIWPRAFRPNPPSR